MKLKLIKNVISVSKITIKTKQYFIFTSRILCIKNKFLSRYIINYAGVTGFLTIYYTYYVVSVV